MSNRAPTGPSRPWASLPSGSFLHWKWDRDRRTIVRERRVEERLFAVELPTIKQVVKFVTVIYEKEKTPTSDVGVFLSHNRVKSWPTLQWNPGRVGD
jgi:hypothetical protein